MTFLMNKLKEILEAGLDKKDVQYINLGKPYSVSKQVLDRGFLCIQPVATDVESVTTGITDEDVHSVKIILAKNVQDEIVKDSQKESGTMYLARVMDGRDASGNVLTNSIRTLIRRNMRNLGITQDSISIDYDTDELDNVAEGTVTATLMLSQKDHASYTLV